MADYGLDEALKDIEQHAGEDVVKALRERAEQREAERRAREEAERAALEAFRTKVKAAKTARAELDLSDEDARELFAPLGEDVVDAVLADKPLKTTKVAGGGGRARVSRDAVVTHAMGRVDGFTVQDVCDETGASVQSVRKVLNDLVSTGKLRSQDDTTYTGRGRKPKVYFRR